MTTAQIIAKYGKPGESQLTTIKLPYPMRIAWDPKTTVKTIRCHKLVANQLTAIFGEILAHYGLAEIQRLGIDLFGGCYNFRHMRGGSDWSRHSWGIAIDLDPARNQLKWGKDKAQFAKPEYNKLHEIFEKNGFINLGKTKGFDFMHWEAGS